MSLYNTPLSGLGNAVIVQVASGALRPIIPEYQAPQWPLWTQLMTNGWSKDVATRPTFQSIIDQLMALHDQPGLGDLPQLHRRIEDEVCM